MKNAWMIGAMAVMGAGMALSLALTTSPMTADEPKPSKPKEKPIVDANPEKKNLKTATFGAGCFWCIEAVFQELKGVEKVVSGYSGGSIANPSYEQVSSGDTGHAEVAQISYDPAVVTFPELLEVFWKTHDPTTLNRQGNDWGSQYRSAIYYADDDQKKLAEEYKAKLNASGAFGAPIVTEIAPLKAFYPAENYHQNYFKSNPTQGYCRAIIAPKMDKFRKVFHDKLKN